MGNTLKIYYHLGVEYWKKNSIPTIIMSVSWLVLGIIRSMGVQTVFLVPFYFLTGALLGTASNQFIGGVVGKTLLLLMVNQFLYPFFLGSGNKKELLQKSWMNFKEALLKKIPNYSDFKQLKDSKPNEVAWNLLGLGSAFVVHPFITGDGNLQNSFVIVALVMSLITMSIKKKNMLVTFMNRWLRKFGKKLIDLKKLDRILSGNTLGFVLTVAFSTTFQPLMYYVIGLVVVGFSSVVLMQSGAKQVMPKEIA